MGTTTMCAKPTSSSAPPTRSQGRAGMSNRWIAAVLALHGLSLGCAGGDGAQRREAVEWQGTVSTEGALSTVRTDSGSEWKAAELVETASIGTLEGEDAYVFSQVTSVAATEDRIFVLDAPMATVRVYDVDGRHLRDIGRLGDGPGEFRRPWALAIVDRERLLVRDRAQGRVHELSLNGELLGDFRVDGAARTVFTDDGVVYVHNWLPFQDGEPRRLGMLSYGPDGPGTPIPIPESPAEPEYVPVDRQFLELGAGAAAQQGLTFNVNEVPFAPQPLWWLASDASMVTGYPDTYRFERLALDGTVLRVEKSWQPVTVHPDEADWYRGRLLMFWRALIPEFIWQAADVPDHKRAYMALVPDRDGRVWVIREMAGERIADCDEEPEDMNGYVERPCWRQAYVLEGFGTDGRYLGQVGLPDGLRFSVQPYIRGDQVVAVFEDEAGAIMVKHFRLEVSE